jgi:hypothetical protein
MCHEGQTLDYESPALTVELQAHLPMKRCVFLRDAKASLLSRSSSFWQRQTFFKTKAEAEAPPPNYNLGPARARSSRPAPQVNSPQSLRHEKNSVHMGGHSQKQRHFFWTTWNESVGAR